MAVRRFDLNVEEMLDNWEVHHAVREIIANGLDEQTLSNTSDVDIFRSEGDWRIRDYGRGLRIEHFTLNENKEKLSQPSGVIGKFGVGLKDALAVLHRRGVDTWICSRYGVFHIIRARKHDFEQIVTLHVEYDDTPKSIEGTEFVLCGISDADIAQAKSCFLRFRNESVLDSSHLGEILGRTNESACVYINGVLAAEEPNFLFSYNVISLTDSMRKQLNRERINVGRSVYVERVKALLKAASSETVKATLAEQMLSRHRGDQYDELRWIEISQMALNLLHERHSVAYVTQQQVEAHPDLVEGMRRDGHGVVVVDEREYTRLEEQPLLGGPTVRTLPQYVTEYNESFAYSFVDRNALTADERAVFDLTRHILGLVNLGSDLTVRISETMRLGIDDTNGVWDTEIESIVIRRALLGDPEEYAGTLLHEAAHATSGYADLTRGFEDRLSTYLGRLAIALLEWVENCLEGYGKPRDTGPAARRELGVEKTAPSIQTGEVTFETAAAAWSPALAKMKSERNIGLYVIAEAGTPLRLGAS
ncbi:MAG: ATP-binding protein [Armatimonadota bacterium]|nr:ATP-binding protein [Armatimonadota bacterium]